MSTKGSKAAPSSAVAKPYEPTSREQEAIEAHFARMRKRPPAPRMMVKGVSEIAVDHLEPAQALLMEAIGTADRDFMDGLSGNS